MFRTKKQLDRGSIGSGLGLLGYLLLLKGNAPSVVGYVVLVVTLLGALWTEISIVTYPKEQKETDINYNNLWGQSAMTLLLLGLAFVAVKQGLGL